jgi:hypothetical protein
MAWGVNDGENASDSLELHASDINGDTKLALSIASLISDSALSQMVQSVAMCTRKVKVYLADE